MGKPCKRTNCLENKMPIVSHWETPRAQEQPAIKWFLLRPGVSYPSASWWAWQHDGFPLWADRELSPWLQLNLLLLCLKDRLNWATPSPWLARSTCCPSLIINNYATLPVCMFLYHFPHPSRHGHANISTFFKPKTTEHRCHSPWLKWRGHEIKGWLLILGAPEISTAV